MSEYVIRTPIPHAKQAEFLDSKAKRKVIVAGRRGGKTTVAAILATDWALDGRRVLEAAPTADQTTAFWDSIKRYFLDPIANGKVHKNDSERLLELPNGGRIRCKTAHDADTLRGDYADLLILDEYSFMNPNAWDQVGAPMLLDNDGDAVFIFTPLRRNHAFHRYAEALADTTGRWGAWHFTSFDNPYLSKEALADITADMTGDAYRQEIMAEFLENEGAVFRNIRACLHNEPTVAGQHRAHRVVAGVDWAQQNDFTAISVVCADCALELALDRFNQIDYTFQRGRLKALVDKWRVTDVLAEANAMGTPIIDTLQREGLPVRAFMTTASSKPPLIESLALAFERAEVRWLADDVATLELEAYERQVNAKTSRASYGAPEGLHDDTVIARALANAARLAGLSRAYVY